MEREIKFRAISIKDEFIFGSLVYDSIGKPRITEIDSSGNGLIFHHVRPETVGQFTGLKDKNGVDIYENDVVNSVYFKNAVVVFWKTGWHFEVNKDEHHSLNTAIYSFEIIGNIHNPHKKP